MSSPTLQIQLFGGLDLRLDDVALPAFESARAESLFAYLLLHRDRPQSRQQLAFLLWPDSSESQARTNLRHVLHTLRHALPDADRFLAITPRTLQWRHDAAFWLDVAVFEAAVSQSTTGSGAEVLAALRDAVALYSGHLLPAGYDEWLVAERERLRRLFLDALRSLSALLEARKDFAEAIPYAECLLREDPLDEQTYRLLMRLHSATGNRAQALRVYHLCVSTLDRELGVEPAASTRLAYEALLPGALEDAVARAQPNRVAGAPLIGRAAAWERLTSLWRDTEGGRAQLVLISGEPGIGKTRLVEELHAWVAHRDVATAEARSYAAEGPLPFGPLATWLRADAIRGNVTRLEHAHTTALARLLPELRGEADDGALPDAVSEREQRLRIFEAATIAMLAAGRTLLLVADDLQWCDPPTLQFLHYLLRSAPDARILIAATARREDISTTHPLRDLLTSLHQLERVTEIELDRLTATEAALLGAHVAGQTLTEHDATRLHAETEGNPLFIVEALRSGWLDAGSKAISPKVQAVIESRLAQLSTPARDLVDTAATIGREFSPDILAQAGQVDEDALVRALDELWQRRIFRERGSRGYDFSHDKIREVAYQQLAPARRRRLHAAVAQGLERLYTGNLDAVSSQIASHWERAGHIAQAVPWYVRAADVAQQVYANVEAIRLLSHARDLVQTLPQSPARASQEMTVLAALPVSLGWVEGMASQRLKAVHQRALELAASSEMPIPSPLLRSLALTSLTQSDFAAARHFGTQLRERGEHQADPLLTVESAYILGIAAFWQGELTTACNHFATAIDRYQPSLRRMHIFQYGLDPKVVCLSRLGNTLWFRGQPAAAVRARDEALALADAIGHPFSRSTALVFASMLALEMDDVASGQAYAEALLAERGAGTKPTRVHADALAGYLDVVAGRVAPGMARIQLAVDETREAEHAPGIYACMLRLLLEACAVSGNHEARLATADRMLALTAVRLWEAEARRQRAESLRALGAPAAIVEADFAAALQAAHRQQARMLELRAASGLLQFRQHSSDAGAIGEARDRLAELLASTPSMQDTPAGIHACSLLA